MSNIFPILRELAGCWENIDSILRESMEMAVPIHHSQGSKVTQNRSKSLKIAQNGSKSPTIAQKLLNICSNFLKNAFLTPKINIFQYLESDRWVQYFNIFPILREELTNIQYQYLERCKTIFLRVLRLQRISGARTE